MAEIVTLKSILSSIWEKELEPLREAMNNGGVKEKDEYTVEKKKIEEKAKTAQDYIKAYYKIFGFYVDRLPSDKGYMVDNQYRESYKWLVQHYPTGKKDKNRNQNQYKRCVDESSIQLFRDGKFKEIPLQKLQLIVHHLENGLKGFKVSGNEEYYEQIDKTMDKLYEYTEIYIRDIIEPTSKEVTRCLNKIYLTNDDKYLMAQYMKDILPYIVTFLDLATDKVKEYRSDELDEVEFGIDEVIYEKSIDVLKQVIRKLERQKGKHILRKIRKRQEIKKVVSVDKEMDIDELGDGEPLGLSFCSEIDDGGFLQYISEGLLEHVETMTGISSKKELDKIKNRAKEMQSNS